jgi:cell division protease FtsH
MTIELGFVAYEEQTSQFLDVKESLGRNSYSDHTARAIDDCVKKIVMEAYDRAYNFLSHQQELLERAAKTLMERETLSEDELKVFFRELDLVPLDARPVLAEELRHH